MQCRFLIDSSLPAVCLQACFYCESFICFMQCLETCGLRCEAGWGLGLKSRHRPSLRTHCTMLVCMSWFINFFLSYKDSAHGIAVLARSTELVFAVKHADRAPTSSGEQLPSSRNSLLIEGMLFARIGLEYNSLPKIGQTL